MVELNLGGNKYTPEGCKWLARYLLGATKLQSFHISQSYGLKEGGGGEWVMSALPSSLNELHFLNCGMGI